MKNQLIILCVFGLSVGSIFLSCNNKNEEVLTPKINPAFEQNPPIAKNVFIQKLKKPTAKGNILVMAEFEDNIVETPFLVVNIGEEQTTLFDNGKNGDEKKGDGIFSTIVQDDESQLVERFTSMNLAMDKGRRVKRFINRVSIPTPTEDRDVPIRIESFQKFEKIKLPPLVFTSGVVDPLLRFHSLMIIDVSVVDDPTRTFELCNSGAGNPSGVWTFWELMRQMASPNPGNIANDLQTSAFILNWLNTWNMSLTVNGELLPGRGGNPGQGIQDKVIGPWIARSGGTGILLKEESPFRLTAIVNRLDLRGNSGYGFSDAGEGRFVFSVIDKNTCSKLGNGFNVILEYGINKKSCTAVKAFAQEWHDLKNLALGSAAYNNALELITMQFSQCGTNSSKPNQNSINQVRTNELGMSISPWQLREFNLVAAGGLQLVTVKQEPAVKYNAQVNNPDVELLVDYINTNTVAIENGTHVVPLTYNGQDFLGGKSHTNFPGSHWNGDPTASSGPTHIISDEARFRFSLTTCSGCHGGDTKTFFVHIADNSTSGTRTPAGLSGFLTGLGPDDEPSISDDDTDPTGDFFVRDAADRPTAATATLRGFNDLHIRAEDLDDLVNNTCGKFPVLALAHNLTFVGNPMTH